MSTPIKNLVAVNDANQGVPSVKAHIEGLDGEATPATLDTYGTVKQALRVVGIAKADLPEIETDAPTKEQYNDLVALANELKHNHNSLLTMLKESGAMQK